MTAAAEVLRLPEGSVLVLRGVDLGEAGEVVLVRRLAEVAGHDRFLVLHLPAEGTAEVWDPDVDLLGKVRELLGPARWGNSSVCPWCMARLPKPGAPGHMAISEGTPAPAFHHLVHRCAGGIVVEPCRLPVVEP